jgi:hypothetical protein
MGRSSSKQLTMCARRYQDLAGWFIEPGGRHEGLMRPDPKMRAPKIAIPG